MDRVGAAELEAAPQRARVPTTFEQGHRHREAERAQPNDRGQDEEAVEEERRHEQHDTDREGDGHLFAGRPFS